MSSFNLYAGCGKADITPEVGGHLYGYNDYTVSTSCHDRLDVKVLALSDGENAPVLLYSLSIGDYGTAIANEVRGLLSQEFCIPIENLVMSAIHTHSGPNVCGVSGWGDADRPYINSIFIPAVREATRQALEKFVPVEYAINEGISDVGVNRRQMLEDGSIDFGQTPWGDQDKTMSVIRFRNVETGQGVFQMIHYGCHGTAAGHNHEISRDWIGVMLDRVEAVTGIMTGFWNGCVGDVGPRLTNGDTIGDIHYAEELGGVAALDAVRIANGLNMAQYDRGKLTVLSTVLSLPTRPLMAKEQVDAYLSTHPADANYVNMDGLIDWYMRQVAVFYESGEEHPTEKDIPTTVVALGKSIVFCPMPYELFSDICLRLRRFSPFTHTMAISLTNGYEAYLPTQAAIPYGGYEVSNAQYGSLTALREDCDIIVVRKFLEKLREIYV